MALCNLKRVNDTHTSGRRELDEIIERCRTIEEKGLNPFAIDIESIIRVIREYFPSWEKPEELSLDAETVNRLASVIRLQSEWLQRRSSSLYMDPLIVERRLKELSRDELASVIVLAWRPILDMETLTVESLRDAADYWALTPALSQRWSELTGYGSTPDVLNRQEFLSSSLLDEETFESRLTSLHDELKREANQDRTSYWDFISVDSFEKTVERSYLASFLVSYGWATLQIHPIEGEIFIRALPKASRHKRDKMMPTSIVLTISREDWEGKRGKK